MNKNRHRIRCTNTLLNDKMEYKISMLTYFKGKFKCKKIKCHVYLEINQICLLKMEYTLLEVFKKYNRRVKGKQNMVHEVTDEIICKVA